MADAAKIYEVSDREKEMRSKERLEAFVAELETEAGKRESARATVELRWLEDLRQYHGIYDEDTSRTLEDKKTSQVFMNLTRTKTDAIQARLWDLLFPTDDRNWGIRPTPVPDMAETSEEVGSVAQDASDTTEALKMQMAEAEKAGDQETMAQLQGQIAQAEQIGSVARAAADKLQETLGEATRRCRLMEEEISDQLVHSNYQAEARDAIQDACKIGIGILKGPIIGETVKQKWVIEGGQAMLVDEVDGMSADGEEQAAMPMPAIKRVDPWGFFPSTDARTPADSEGFFERHLMTKRQMRELARRPDIDQDAMREILRQPADQGDLTHNLPDLMDLTNQKTNRAMTGLYKVWEYTGPISAEQLEVLANDLDDETAKEVIGEHDDTEAGVDPLAEINLRIWFCQGKVLSVALYPLDSQEPMYSVFTLAHDEYSLFGFGMPYIIRDPQAMMNAATRMLMDNAALSTSPQIVVNRDVIRPTDGDYTLRAGKVWTRNKADAAPNVPAFETYNIPGMQAELGGIIEMSKAMIDEMSGLPAVAQGEQGAGVTKTAQGMALLMNSANVAFRRYIKNFDDDMTRPLIRRMYHFNMQFSHKEEIKGDYEVDARGSSVLLVREMQANNLMLIAQTFGEHPTFGPRIKNDALLAEIMRAHMIPAHEILYTEGEFRAKQEEQAAQQGKTDPAVQAQQMQAEVEQAKLELAREELGMKREMHQLEMDTRRAVAEMEIEEARIRAGLNVEAKRDNDEMQAALKLEAQRSKERVESRKIESSERKLAAEVGEARRTGRSAGGSV